MHAQPIFVERQPVLGLVPMSFYLPESVERADTKAIIEKYGGKVEDEHECFSYQICPCSVEIPKQNYHYGDVYSVKWIVDSIMDKELKDPLNYLKFVNNENNGENIKRLVFSKSNTLYTIREGLKIFWGVGLTSAIRRGNKCPSAVV